MTFKERILAEETKLGHVLKRYVAGFLLLLSILGGANEYLAVLPPDWIPTWAKTLILVSGLASYVIGKLTVKPNLNEGNSKVL